MKPNSSHTILTALSYCPTTSERSKPLKTVSVIRRSTDGWCNGDTLDGLAFVQAQKNKGAHPQGARALLLGGGGAGSALAVALLEAGVRELIIHDTNQARLAELVKLATGRGQGRVTSGPPDPRGCDMVCNATVLGMAQEDPLPVTADLLAPFICGRCHRRMWGNPLLSAARVAGCKTANGDQMVEAVQEMMRDFLQND